MYYYLIIGLQLFCLYHCYQNYRNSHWYYVIIFLPLVGSLFYFYTHLMTRDNLDSVSEKIKGTVNKNYEFDKLLNEAKYSDTFANRIKLADHYAAKEQYLQAISLYESCLEGYNADDLRTMEKLMVAKYFIYDYEGVVSMGDALNDKKTFKNSESRITYAWSLSYLDQEDKAEATFQDMDVRFGNYVHRCEYARYLLQKDRSPEAAVLLEKLRDEIEHMDKSEKKQKKDIVKEISMLYKSV